MQIYFVNNSEYISYELIKLKIEAHYSKDKSDSR